MGGRLATYAGVSRTPSREIYEPPNANTKDRTPAYVFALLLNALQTLPFIGIVQTLSSSRDNKFTPCSSFTCTLWSITNYDGQHPSTMHWRQNSSVFGTSAVLFHMVRNGDAGLVPPADGYMPPLCPGNSSTSMRELCHTQSVRAGIVNGLAQSYFKFMYLGFCACWFGTKVFHDWALLCGAKERVTVQVGLLAWCFEALGVAIVFLWCHEASGVFIAPIVGARCACYYLVSDVECFLAFSTPMYLLIRSIFKLEKILRSTLFGDFLYFARFEVPFYIVDASLQQPMDPYIVATTHGMRLFEREEKMFLSSDDIATCLACYTWVLQPLRVAMVTIVSVALFPISVRFLNLLDVRHPLFWRELLLVTIVVAATGAYVRAEMGRLIDFHTCTLQSKFRYKKGLESVRAMLIPSFRSSLMCFAAERMLAVLFHTAYGRSGLTPWDVLWWSASCSICMYNFVARTFSWRCKCVVRAMKMKAGNLGVSPEVFIQMANDYPEFALDEERAWAEQALQCQITRDKWSDLQKRIPKSPSILSGAVSLDALNDLQD